MRTMFKPAVETSGLRFWYSYSAKCNEIIPLRRLLMDLAELVLGPIDDEVRDAVAEARAKEPVPIVQMIEVRL
jgi:hypothetical protein